MKKLFIILTVIIFLGNFISALPQISNVSINPENPTIIDTINICANVNDTSEIIIVRINLHSETPLWNWGLVMDKENSEYCKTLSPYLMDAYESKIISYYLSAMNVLGEIISTETYYFTYRAVPFCGDGVCDSDFNENCSTCSNDCGQCPFPPPTPIDSSSIKIKISGYRQIGEFCEPNWQCTGWDECLNGFMIRDCYDTNRCSYNYNKPAEVVGCEKEIEEFVVEKKGITFNGYLLFGGVIVIVLLTILILLLAVTKTLKKLLPL